jgi:DNA-binding MarR family transcriptional regulator
VKPDNIATFLGQKITWNFQKEAGTNFNRRILGTRIKHHMGDVSIKMYDKQGLVLRIECTCNNIGDFRVNREVLHRDGTTSVEKAPLKKSIYSLFRLFTIMKSANYRYLEFASNFDDHSDGEKKLVEVTQSVLEDGRSFKGINFFETRDLSVLQTLGRGEFQTFGLRNKQLREHLPEIKPSAMTRILKRLRLHNLIEKIQHSSRYSITALGRQVITAGLAVRNLVIVPALTAT